MTAWSIALAGGVLIGLGEKVEALDSKNKVFLVANSRSKSRLVARLRGFPWRGHGAGAGVHYFLCSFSGSLPVGPPTAAS